MTGDGEHTAASTCSQGGSQVGAGRGDRDDTLPTPSLTSNCL